MKRTLLFTFLLVFFKVANAGRVSGIVTDTSGTILSYASIQVKGTSIGTTANIEGKFFLNLKPGNYTLICQHVNYKRTEKEVLVTEAALEINFRLLPQQFIMQEVIIKRGEDPAYEIIRKTIKKRKLHKDELQKFTVEVYTKGQLKMRDHPKKFFGKKVDFEDGDTSKIRFLYLSESISKYSVEPPGKSKIEVLATKVSGSSDGLGLASGQMISFYENNLIFGANLNPRGFISPIADNALNFYKYKYEGSFFEEGRHVSKIRVIPKRKYEPLFSGHIHIIEDEWRIHSLQLLLTKESQMELIDTLRLEQLYIQHDNKWVLKSQLIYPAIKIFGFDNYGSFANIYSAYDLNPQFPKGFFDKTVLKYTDSSNKKSLEYWDEARPVILLQDEEKDYQKKDSLEKRRKDPAYLDSIDKKQNRISASGLLLVGETFSKRSSRAYFRIPSVLESISFNTVEGFVIDFRPSFNKRLDTSLFSSRRFTVIPALRYGFSEKQFRPSLYLNYTYGKSSNNSFALNFGSTVFQFNNENPIRALDNSISSLRSENNFMKIYGANFAQLDHVRGLGNGFQLSATLQYQDRIPLSNTTDYTWRDRKDKFYTPNYPVELTNSPMLRHTAFIGSFKLSWQPGVRYVEVPGRKFSIASKLPVFHIGFTKGFKNIFGSDIDYAKWNAGISHRLNLKLGGSFSYRINIGGFLQKNKVEIPDYTHFNGNQFFAASQYLNSFQLAPYYQYSNTKRFYTTAHAEHHFNGLLTNKIPLFKRLNWHLVAGSNAFYVNRSAYYAEVFAGIENIFKIFRVDFINGYEPGGKIRSAIRLGVGGAFSNRR